MSRLALAYGLVGLSLLFAAPASSAGPGLYAPIKGVRNAKGRIGCLLFASAGGLPAHGTFGPKFDDARFDYRGGNLAMPITLTY
jgi:uncharacterized protein (DUF2141 family)